MFLQSDNEPAIKSSGIRLRDMRSHMTVGEESLEYEPQASGLVQTRESLV